MKLQQTYLKQKTFRFKRWSRKGYAAFFSLGRAVTIGQLSSNVAERFQIKNGSNHSSVLLTGQIVAFTDVTSSILITDGKTDIGSGFVRLHYYMYIS